jgi:predicted dehydrogenase
VVNIGIISFEHMHAFSYASALMQSPKTRFTAYAEENPTRFSQIKKMFPGIQGYRSWEMLVRESDCAAVIVTSANARHKAQVMAAARAGKHVLCEKPIATSVSDARKMIEACRKAHVKLQTAFPVRYCPAITRAKIILSEKKLGSIIAIKTTNHGSMPGGWFVEKKLSGGGAIMDHTVHVADLLRFLLGEEIVEVYAEETTKLHPLSVEDCGLLMLKMSGGSFASLDTSWSRPRAYKIWGDVTLEFKGKDANLSVNCFPGLVDLYLNKTMKHSSFSGGDNYDLALVEDFADCIASGREPSVSGMDGYKAMEVALAAYKAIKTKSPVSLPL